MALYRAASNAKAGVNTANTVMWGVHAGSSERIWIKEFGITVATAPTTAPQFVIARSTAAGTASATVAGQAIDTNDPAALGLLETAWSSAPTFNTSGPFLFAITLPVTAGSGYVWQAPDDRSRIALTTSTASATNAQLVIANAAASGATLGAFSFYCVWEE